MVKSDFADKTLHCVVTVFRLNSSYRKLLRIQRADTASEMSNEATDMNLKTRRPIGTV